ncbi:MAG: D-3-phosphoglycerate dehydrogenase / 2-oxoglutarate reductase, partial [Thermovirga sp.]|nr:D-3-phosphoglycerate dehydrogenase / 2-oxoglutarate reductase [Thermovirga sp.]
MWKILVTEKIHPSGLKELRKDPEVELLEKVDMSEEEFFHLVKDVDALVTRSGTSIDKRVLDEAKRLKVVARAGVGVDNIDLDWASRKGVVVINAPTGNTLAATEHTFALLLSICRKLPHGFNDLARGGWNRKAFMGMQLHGKTLLIIGLGRIGSQVAKRAKAFGMEVLAYDPYISARKVEELGVRRALELEGALALADVVTLHTPLTSETKGMIDERTLKAFKKGAILINCARGGLVDEQACADAIREGRLAGAAFDVFSQEPP